MRTRVAIALTGGAGARDPAGRSLPRAGHRRHHRDLGADPGAALVHLGHVAVHPGHAGPVHRRLDLLQGHLGGHQKPLDQHGHAYRGRHDDGLRLQRCCDLLPVGTAGRDRGAERLLRGLGSHHRLRPARQVHGGDRQETVVRGRAQAARPQARNSAGDPRRYRNGGARGIRDDRRGPGDPARREGADGRHGH